MLATCSEATRAVPMTAAAATVVSPSLAKVFTSEDIVEAIDQDELLSLAVATLRPVEISSWTLAMPLLVAFKVCRATIALVLVRIEAIAVVLQVACGAFDAACVMDGPAHAEPMNALLTAAVPGPVRIQPRRPFGRVGAHSAMSVNRG